MNEYSKLPEMVYSIEEFKDVFKEFEIDEDKVRFYLGKYHLAPKAYGIYQIDDDYIVYKIKNNGDTTIRYKGPSEQRACNELYTKFLQEISRRKTLSKKYNPYHDENYTPVRKQEYIDSTKNKKQSKNILIFIIIAFIIIDLAIVAYKRNNQNTPQTEYYQYNDDYYKHYNNNWYYWDNTLNDWFIFYPSYDEYYYYDNITDPDDNSYYNYDYNYDYDYSYDNDYEYYDDYGGGYDEFDSYDFDFGDSYSDWDSDW